MAKPEPQWVEEEPDDRPPPEAAPADWAPPTPVETQIEMSPGIQVESQEPPEVLDPGRKKRVLWTTTAVYGALWVFFTFIFTTEGGPLVVALVLLPFYLLTLPFVLRTPKKYRKRKAKLIDRIDWQYRLMISVVVFLAIYVPFTFVSALVIPYASVVEYLLFALLLFVLIRLGGRAVGVAPSLDALPPPSHRLHQQVVAPIDDAHYQRTLWLHFSFVEKGRGAKHLAKRLDEILDQNGVSPERRAELLRELHTFEDGGWGLGRRRDRRVFERDRRVQVLERLFADLNRELEQAV